MSGQFTPGRLNRGKAALGTRYSLREAPSVGILSRYTAISYATVPLIPKVHRPRPTDASEAADQPRRAKRQRMIAPCPCVLCDLSNGVSEVKRSGVKWGGVK
jgi:hypothetical protein